MIGSHNTFTYLKSSCPAMNMFKKYWKCQGKTIQEQYDFGIRMFDIRVTRSGGYWKPAHGLANLKGIRWSNIINLADYMRYHFPEALYRICLEKGDSNDEKLYKSNIQKIISAIDDGEEFMLWRASIKKTKEWKEGVFNQNKKLYDMGYKFAMVNTWISPSHELHGYINSVKDYRVDLKKEAKKINSQLDFFNDPEKLKEMLESKEELYFLDYATNEF